MSEIVKINPSEYGLTDQTAQNIASQFQPMLDKMVEMEKEFNKVIALPIDSPLTAKAAKELRNRYVKLRTATADIHKEQKAFYLNGGRFVDGWKNAQIFASQGKEETLEKIEKYLENLEKQRIAALNAQRVELVRPYVEDVSNLTALHVMENDVFDAYLAAKKTAYNDRIETERIVAEQKLAKEREELAAREAQRLENERLKAEAQARELEIAKERAETQRLQKEAEAKLKAEAQARELLQAQIAKAEQEAKEKTEQEAKEAEKLAKAPIKNQMLVWIEGFEIGDAPAQNETTELIIQKFNAFKEWAKTQTTNL